MIKYADTRVIYHELNDATIPAYPFTRTDEYLNLSMMSEVHFTTVNTVEVFD